MLLQFESLYKKISDENEERKRAQGEVSRLASIVSSSDDAIIGKTLDGVITSWNKGAEQIYGYSEAEAVGKPIGIIMPPDRKQELDKILDKIRRGERVEHYETARVARDGRRIDVSITISPIVDAAGNVTGASTIARDITERRRAGEALRESEEKFRVLAKTSSAVIYVYQGENIVYVNDAAERITGYSMDELLKMKFWDIVHPDFKELVKERGLARQRGEPVPSPYEFKFITKSGETRWAELTAGRIEYMSKPAGVTTFFDITERKRAEDAIKSSEAKFRTIFENAGIAIFIADIATGKIVECNSNAEHLIGRARSEIVGMHQSMVHPYGEEEKYREIFDLHTRHGYHDNCEAEVQHKDGRRVPVWINAQPLRIGGRDTLIGFFIDITERKRAEEALRLARFSVDKAADGIFWILQDGRVFYANNAACAMLGYSREELQGMYVWDFDPIFSRDAWQSHWRDLKRQGSVNIETKHKASDGRVFPVEISANYLEFDGNEYNFAFVKDITERKRNEYALRESERRFRGIYEQAPLGIALIDSITGRFLQINQKYCDIVGRTMDEMLAMDFQSITYPDDLQRDLDNMARLIAGEIASFQIEKRYIHVNGSIVWVSLTVVPLWDADSQYKCHIAMVEDITERKRAEEELANAKDQLAAELDAMDRLHAISVQYVLNGNLSAVLDEIIDATVSITKADMGNIQILDPESGRLKIAAQHGFERPFLDYFDSVAEGHAACGTAMMRMERVVVEDVSRSPIFVGTPELEVVLAAGARAVQSTPLLSRSGRLLGVFSTHYLTSRRPDERELKLIDLLARQTADIIERTLAEKQLVDSKAQAELYLDLMGHDINNMHQIALGYLELARDMSAGEEQAVFLDKPVEVLQRSAKLIGNVRKLQKLHDGAFQDQDVDVCKMLSNVQREFGAIPNKKVTLNLNGCESCHVRANELLHDVLANLVGNAIKHTGDRAAINVDLDVVEDDGGRYCRVMVEDDGPGIPDDFKATIFNRALKGTDKAKGIGLGLYLVKSLVDSYGGRVWIEDRIMGDHSKGARFVVMLPAAYN